jgi:hypothetical protein
MRIAINTDVSLLINTLNKLVKEQENISEIINVKVETNLFNTIDEGSIDAFVISNEFSFAKKAIDFIKIKINPYIPIILLVNEETDKLPSSTKADIILTYHATTNIDNLSRIILHNINSYYHNFETLNKLTAKSQEAIEFGKCKYDPSIRMLYYNNKEIAQLSTKQGGVLEILAINYGEVVKKEIILEKVWLESTYFVGRSMDVYVTKLRKLFEANNIDVKIINITNVGLILK